MHKNAKDLTGQKFGRLTATHIAEKAGKSRGLNWAVSCDCGAQKTVRACALLSGATQSCGCHRREVAKKAGDRSRTHGQSKDSIYNIWDSMHQRCTNPNRKDFVKYGARGISVCERWKEFHNFFADMGDKPAGMSLDRVDNSKGYSPENCRWATAKQQNRNQSSNVNITFNGETMCINAWAEKTGINEITLHARLQMYRWPVARALTTPVKPRKSKCNAGQIAIKAVGAIAAHP